ncbi:UNVERIFIED_CONTAM: hypothetical protein PYX00_001571 [Menopon gallinae]|uniref:Ionotropic glutamate receptor L-glutamate and glycine-binding domain-containing protein n=1 Tax=Menopon gallinae TaxID=328185 RepID=A0AAW2IDU6_9NEOP
MGNGRGETDTSVTFNCSLFITNESQTTTYTRGMSSKCCIISLLALQIHVVFASYPRDSLIEEENSQWCKDHPFGRIYSNGKYHRCSHELEDWEEAQVKNLQMNGVYLRVGVIYGKKSYDYDCGGHYEENHFRSKPSYSSFILNLLRQILGFDIQYVTTDTWGTWDETKKNWTGLVGLARDNVIDLGICHTTITEERENVVDFLLTTLSSTKSFVYSPSKLPLTRDVFVLTFSPMLWLSFFASVVLLILCFRLSTWIHSRLRPDHEPWSWIEIIMWANAAICQQSYSRHPKGSSCRTTFLIGYLITYLLYTGFAAGVTSHLAVQGYDTHLGFKDVVLMKMNLVTQSDGTHFDFIKDSPDPYARSLYSNLYELLKANRVDSLQELFASLEQENFIGLGKLLRMMEAGLLDYGEKEHIRVEDVTCCQQPGWSSAGLGNVLSAVVILCGGWFFSILILFAEIGWKRKSSSSDWEIISRRDVHGQLMRKMGFVERF